MSTVALPPLFRHYSEGLLRFNDHHSSVGLVTTSCIITTTKQTTMKLSCLILTVFLGLFSRTTGYVLCTTQFKNLLACAELSEDETEAIACDSCILTTTATKATTDVNCDDYEKEYCDVFNTCKCGTNCEDAVAAYRDCSADANPHFPSCRIGCRADGGLSISGGISTKAITSIMITSVTGLFLAYF